MLELIHDPGHCTHGDDPRPALGTAADVGTGGSLSQSPTAAVPCYGTGQDGARVQAMYVHQTGGTDRLAQLTTQFGTIAQHMEGVFLQSGQQTNGDTYLRFVTNGDCSLSILDAAVSAAAMTDFGTMVTELKNQGYTSGDRHYLTWVDGSSYCGIAGRYSDDSSAQDNPNNLTNPLFAAVGTQCWNYGEPHELMHTLGAVQGTAPHATSRGHCYDQSDVMCYDDGSGNPMQSICPGRVWYYDCNNDDYFSTNPPAGNYLASHWNTATSRYVMLAPSVALPAVAALPAMSNRAYGGYITAATIQNTGSAAASVRIAYFGQNGAPVGTGDAVGSLPPRAGWTVRQDNGNSFVSGAAGSAIVYSDQPIASFVNEFAPGNAGDATSYTSVPLPSGVGTTLYAPTIVNKAYGGYTTGIGLLNAGTAPTDVTITYRDGAGVLTATQAVSGLAANAYSALYTGDPGVGLPAGFAGTATITSSGQPLGAIVNETGPGGQFSSYDTVPSGSGLLNAPVALNNAFGGYNTGMGIQNTSGIPGTLTVTYYDGAGNPTPRNFNVAANGSVGVYQGSPTEGTPAAGAYTAQITSSLPLAAIVNEVAAPSSGPARQSTSYNTVSLGSSASHLGLVENAGPDGWTTGEGIMNTGSNPTTVTMTYYDATTGAPVGTPPAPQNLNPRAFMPIYQGDATGGVLPAGTRATAVITTSGGQVAVICNESNPTTFMSYGGQ